MMIKQTEIKDLKFKLIQFLFKQLQKTKIQIKSKTSEMKNKINVNLNMIF